MLSNPILQGPEEGMGNMATGATSLEEGIYQLLSYCQKVPNDGTLVPPQPLS